MALEHPWAERVQGQNWISPGNAAKPGGSGPVEISLGKPSRDKRGSHRGSMMSPAGKCCHTFGARAGKSERNPEDLFLVHKPGFGTEFRGVQEGFWISRGLWWGPQESISAPRDGGKWVTG